MSPTTAAAVTRSVDLDAHTTPQLQVVPERARCLSILVPAYNEAATVVAVLHKLLDLDLGAAGFEHEIVVCDDGSQDGTAGLVAALALRHPRVRLVRHAENRGKGAAVRTALAACRGDVCVIHDADLEYEPDDYPALLDRLGPGVRVVYGSRFLERRYPEGMALPNWLANRILTVAANLLFGTAITDEATCLKMFDTALLRSLELESEGFDFCPEVTARVALAGETITEVPIRYRARANHQGKKIRWTDGVQAMRVLVRWRLRGG